jgi:hypothetical protein
MAGSLVWEESSPASPLEEDRSGAVGQVSGEIGGGRRSLERLFLRRLGSRITLKIATTGSVSIGGGISSIAGGSVARGDDGDTDGEVDGDGDEEGDAEGDGDGLSAGGEDEAEDDGDGQGEVEADGLDVTHPFLQIA